MDNFLIYISDVNCPTLVLMQAILIKYSGSLKKNRTHLLEGSLEKGMVQGVRDRNERG